MNIARDDFFVVEPNFVCFYIYISSVRNPLSFAQFVQLILANV